MENTTTPHKKLALVHCPLNLEAQPIPGVGTLPPLALLALATHLEKQFPLLEIEVLDGEHLSIEYIQEQLTEKKFDVVGISVIASEGYRSALEIAKKAKEQEAVVVLGGEHAIIRNTQILSHRPYIDFVVAGQGESALEGIIRKDPLQTIPQLTYREGSVIITNPPKRLPLHFTLVPSRKYIDLASYSKRFQKTLESKLTGFKCFATIRTQDGCLKAIREGVCTFCKRDDLFLAGFRKPDIFWDEISYLESLGVDYAWDIAASFTTIGSKYIWSLAKKRPSESKIRFRVYARADDLAQEENVEALTALGVENVLVGFDSGDQTCLDASNKKTTLKQHCQAAHNLRKYEIATYAGFVLGHLVETKQSMYNTLRHAQELKDILGDKLFRTTTCSKMQLYPGTVEWHRYLETFPEEQVYYENADDIDLQLLSKKYFERYLHLDPSEADEFAEQIRRLSPIKSGKDLKKSVVDEYLKEIHIM